MRLRRTCLLFWTLPRSGLRFRRNISSCCCPAHRPRTHSLLTCGRGGRESRWPVGSVLGAHLQRGAGLWVRVPGTQPLGLKRSAASSLAGAQARRPLGRPVGRPAFQPGACSYVGGAAGPGTGCERKGWGFRELVFRSKQMCVYRDLLPKPSPAHWVSGAGSAPRRRL